ncbi:MAG: hypothetical protein IJ711_05780, partial [Lachnospiraceae bacterium]|nr:hypothetical protein [Lachnospiraceae bacterium]
MDTREVLQPGTVLPFPEMECTVETVIGRGSNAVVYQGSYPDRQHPELRHRVLVKELFPFHPKGLIYRDEKGEICKEPEAEELMQLHRHSFEKGNEIHLRLLEEYPGDIDANINTFSMHQTLYTVLGFSGGRSLDKELRASGAAAVSLAVHIRRMQGVLRILDAFHASGYLHLDISPDNLLLIGDGKKERVTLIDYNSVHAFQEVRSGRPFYSCAKEGYTAPEIRLGKRADIGPATDLYSLAAVFYRCLTGKKLMPCRLHTVCVRAETQIFQNTVFD